MTTTTNPFQVGDLALHVNNQLDSRPVAAVEGDTIRLDIFGHITDPVPAANYHRIPRPTPIPAGKTPAWFVVWTCGCSDTRTDPSSLPVRCPGHDRERVQAPELLDVLDKFLDVHDCGDRPCAEAVAR